MEFDRVDVPEEGERVEADGDEIEVPDDPVIPYITGDGIGTDVTPAARHVLDAAAEATGREIHWTEIYAGERAEEEYGELLPDETLEAIRYFRVALKGPLTTPVGEGFRSLNVAIRKDLDLYANVRPVYYLEGVPSPVNSPEDVDMVVFREATEDVYSGIEWESGSEGMKRVQEFLNEEMGEDVPGDAGIGVKPISERKTKRLVRKAIKYALERGRDSVTIVHKGNIMKYTEGAFRDWGYELAEEEFPDETITEDELWEEHDGEHPGDVVVMKDRIADNMLQQLLIRTDEYGVLAMPNLNGDYLSDAAAGQVGGLGIAPGSNIGDGMAVFEPVHGSAPKYAGQDKVNPTAMILTGRIMFEYFGWYEAADMIRDAVEETIKDRTVTYDIDRQIEGGERVSTSSFAELVAEKI
ncbi:MAG: isocitrate dehydrogenase (NADP(+)) [Halobacteriales archaeon]